MLPSKSIPLAYVTLTLETPFDDRPHTSPSLSFKFMHQLIIVKDAGLSGKGDTCLGQQVVG
jgi:hypothetical protein